MSLLTRLSLANRSLVALVTVIVAGFGFYAVPSLRQQLLPSLEFPAAFVTAPYLGASPEVVEEQVTEPIETSLRGIDGVTEISSTSREGVATVQVMFAYGTDLDEAVRSIERAVDRAGSQLPDNVEPTVMAGSTEDLPAVVLAASSDSAPQEFARQLERVVVPEIQGIDGVREATVTGARDEVVTIALDPAKLATAGQNMASVSNALLANGIPIPAGTITAGERTLTVQVGSRLTSVDELKNLFLTPAAPGSGSAPGSDAGDRRQAPGSARPTPGGSTAGGAPQPTASSRPVRLGDVADVTQVLAPATSLTRTDGRDSLGVSITMNPDANAVDISHAVRGLLPELADSLGGNAELTVVFDQAPFVEKSIEGLTTEGLLGLGFAVLVILVFLLSVRSTMVTAMSIPLSVLIALLALWSGDLSLNLLTLGALTIAIGRVVDDSIVVLENIKRHLSYGEHRRHAILAGVREVATAVTASTLTTVAVFAPIAIVGGMVGELFAPFAITVTVALLASLLVSLTIVPVLAYWFLKPPKAADAPDEIRARAEQRERRGLLQRMYVPVLRFATRFRVVTLLLALGIFAGTLAMVPRLETNFLDRSGQNNLFITQDLPVGTSLEATDAAARKVEEVLAAADEITSYQVTVGSGGAFGFGFGGDASSASFSITTVEGVDMPALEKRLRDQLAALTRVGEITVGADGGGGGLSSDRVQVRVQAPDQETLRAASDLIRQKVAEVPDLTDVDSDLAESIPRIDVAVDRQAAARYGLSEAVIGQAVAQAFRGTTVTQLATDGQQRDVVLRVGPAPTSLKSLRALTLPTAAGPVRLDRVAKVSEVDGPVQITRTDGARTATVSATATGANLGATTEALRSRLASLDLPAGASYDIGGASADQQEAFADLGLALLAAIAIVFVIMVATFRSLLQPLILLVSVPFAATGAIGLLLATRTALGVPALIGMLMLVGIVVTNAIVLMDLVNQYRAAGMGVREAVIEGGRHRLRPILMTAVATICALVPMSLGLTGGGGFIAQPLAIVVIGGLVSSTILTLVLVPTLYSLVEGAKERLRRRRGSSPDGERASATAPSAPAPAGVY